jgi:oxygen-independent coproporphyrinogen-3 oxidase
MASGKPIFEEEHLTPSQQYNEYVMTSLRTVWGCDQQEIGRRFGAEYQDYFCLQAIRCLASGHLQETDGIYTLTRQGKFLADRITAELFYLE